MRQFCAQNFSSIECNFEELSCKRPATLTDSRVYSLFEYTKTGTKKSRSSAERSTSFYSEFNADSEYVILFEK